MSERESIVWKIIGPLAFALLVTVAGVVYAGVDKRITRLEDILDRIIPTLYRIEETTRNSEYLLQEHMQNDNR